MFVKRRIRDAPNAPNYTGAIYPTSVNPVLSTPLCGSQSEARRSPSWNALATLASEIFAALLLFSTRRSATICIYYSFTFMDRKTLIYYQRARLYDSILHPSSMDGLSIGLMSRYSTKKRFTDNNTSYHSLLSTCSLPCQTSEIVFPIEIV